jgi:hypothetical protein
MTHKENTTINKKIKIIIGLAIWLLIAYLSGKYVGSYDAERKQCSIILNSSTQFMDGQKVELFNKTSELFIEKHVEKGIVIYFITFGGFYFFELGYHSSHQ